MPPPLTPLDEDEAYHSSSDSDFDAALSPFSSDDSDGGTQAGNTIHRKVGADGDAEMGSGDEGIIAQGRRRLRKKGKAKGKGNGKFTSKDLLVNEEDEDDEDEDASLGIRVKLRSGRGGKEDSKRKLPDVSTVTIDIDSVWARMNNPQAPRKPPSDNTSQQGIASERPALKELSPSLQTSAPTKTITIPHKYTFAGETHTSTKTVPANSPEALAYLASKTRAPNVIQGPALRRPLARRGLLEPNPSGFINGIASKPRADLPTSIGGNGAKSLSVENKVSGWEGGMRRKKDVKLNTVEKSKLDWQQEVERQGLREELEKAEKSGTSYLGRMEFLGRAEDAREEEGRKWRMTGKT